MKQVTIHSGREYEVLIGQDLLKDSGELIRKAVPGAAAAMIVSDDNVYPLYGEIVRKSLEAAGLQVYSFIFPHGEASKSLETYGKLLQALFEAHLSRNDVCVALGGGVTGDLTGFAASTYQRGCCFVQIPTSLLADVDSSVGGKTAVDLPGGKNQVGTFCQPHLVICDTDTLKTLPEAEYRNGCAEIIKYAVLDSWDLFDQIDRTPICDQYEDIIERCVSIKNTYVEEDEFDTGLRMMLNLGHTVGHTIEACSGYEIAHGQAVAMGMEAVSKAAAERGLLDRETLDRLTELLEKYGLRKEIEYTAEAMAEAGKNDKKNSAGTMRLIVPEGMGHCTIHKVSAAEFVEWLKQGGAR